MYKVVSLFQGVSGEEKNCMDICTVIIKLPPAAGQLSLAKRVDGGTAIAWLCLKVTQSSHPPLVEKQHIDIYPKVKFL